MKINNKKKSFAILGGSFDPPHKGHLKISRFSIKKFNLSKLYWVITKKNPFKKKPFFSVKERIKKCKKIVTNFRKIHVIYLDQKIRSSKSVKVINYLKNKNSKQICYFLIGSDNLIKFHKWESCKKILKNCKLVIFSRSGYDKKAKKSVIMQHLNKDNFLFIKNQKIDISSTGIRKKIC